MKVIVATRIIELPESFEIIYNMLAIITITSTTSYVLFSAYFTANILLPFLLMIMVTFIKAKDSKV